MLEKTKAFSIGTSPLLRPEDPPVFEIFNENGVAPVLLVCDHASRAIPADMESLGLDKAILDRHIAYDIGAAEVTRQLAMRINAVAVLGGYSRLLIDVNRQPEDPGSIPKISDNIVIPGNQDLSGDDRQERIETFFVPYHHAVTNALAHLWRIGPPPALFSIHSFTPSLNGEDRYWDIGVLWNRDSRMAAPMIEKLRAREHLHVGDNEPYSGREIAYTIDSHAGAGGLPNCAVEIRQDHVETSHECDHWAGLLSEVLGEVMADDALHQVEHF